MKANWRTTTAGLITAAACFIVSSPELFTHWPWVAALAKFVATGGLATLGILAADSKPKQPGA